MKDMSDSLSVSTCCPVVSSEVQRSIADGGDNKMSDRGTNGSVSEPHPSSRPEHGGGCSLYCIIVGLNG